MTEQQFYELVKEMREAQRAYFKTRDKSWLNKSKDLEKQVDQAIKEFFDNQIKIEF